MVSLRPCEFSDAVLAHFLDGETRPIEVAVDGVCRRFTGEELARHRGECDDCTLRLAAARRLDALLAASADITVPDETAERIFAEVGSRLRPAPVSVERGTAVRARRVSAAAAILCGVLGFALAHWFDASSKYGRASGADADDESTASAGPSGLEAEPGVLVLSGPRRPLRRSAGTRSLTPDELEHAFLLTAWSRASALGWPRDRGALERDARRAADDFRLRQVEELAERLSIRGVDGFVECIDSSDGDLRERMILAVRGGPRVEQSLGTALRTEDPAVVTVSAQIGGASLDRALASFVGNDERRADRIAEALVAISHRPGRASLLLRLWNGVRIRDEDDDIALVARWFGIQPQECSGQLLFVLRGSRDAEERRACLLALASLADPATAEALIAIVDGPRQHEAELAGFALGQLPVDCDELAVRPVRRGYLRLAALACRRDPVAAHYLRLMRLSDAERSFLEAGRFNQQQFEIAAALCRDRRVEPISSED